MRTLDIVNVFPRGFQLDDVCAFANREKAVRPNDQGRFFVDILKQNIEVAELPFLHYRGVDFHDQVIRVSLFVCLVRGWNRLLLCGHTRDTAPVLAVV